MDDIDIDESLDDLLKKPVNALNGDRNVKNDELNIEKLKKGNEKNNALFDTLITSIRIMKNKCYPLVNNIIYLLTEKIKENFKNKL